MELMIMGKIIIKLNGNTFEDELDLLSDNLILSQHFPGLSHSSTDCYLHCIANKPDLHPLDVWLL